MSAKVSFKIELNESQIHIAGAQCDLCDETGVCLSVSDGAAKVVTICKKCIDNLFKSHARAGGQ